MELALLCEGALAGEGAAWAWLPEGAEEGELAEEGIQGGPAQAAASSKEWPAPVCFSNFLSMPPSGSLFLFFYFFSLFPFPHRF